MIRTLFFHHSPENKLRLFSGIDKRYYEWLQLVVNLWNDEARIWYVKTKFEVDVVHLREHVLTGYILIYEIDHSHYNHEKQQESKAP